MKESAPVIVINDEKFAMPKPKIKLWRTMIRFTEKQQSGEIKGEELFDEMLDLVVVAFKNPKVTRESVEDNVDFDELKAIINHISNQIISLAANKATQFPNGGTPAKT